VQAELTRLIRGFQVSQAIAVAATLGIPDLLADGARTSDELAATTETNADALYRLLRALASVGVLHELDGRSFELTELGAGLEGDGGGFARLIGRDYFWNAWSHLMDSIRTGENAFRLLHGTDVWEYRAQRPEEAAIFDRAMIALTSRVNDAIVEAYDFGRFGVVMDVGGGRGALLSAILAANPQVEGILFDQEHVVSNAVLPDRARAVAGSFFESVPEGADAYVLKSVIHDWGDADAVAILRTVRRAVTADGAVLLVELDLGAPNEAPSAKFTDLNMLVMPGGRERTIEEYGRLFEAAGLRLAGVTPTAAGVQVVEARLEG
jgi:O-methyltransferase domain/Dimerisation domain